MTYKVVKPFNTALQRFAVGASVSAADDLSPHSIDSLRDGKFIASDAPEPRKSFGKAEPKADLT